MSWEELSTAFEDLREFADASGYVFNLTMSKPATASEIAEAEDFVGSKLPTSVVALLTKCNGLSMSFAENMNSAVRRHDLDLSFLRVYSTIEITRSTASLREHLSGIEIEAYGPDPLRSKAFRCASIARTEGSNYRLVYSPDEPRSNSEYAIFEADMAEMNWLNYLDGDIAQIEIACSIDALLLRAIQFMLVEKSGFDFWGSMRRPADSGN